MGKTRFLDNVGVNAFGNTMPEAITTASGGAGDITFTRANGTTFTLPLAASASSADALTTASVVDNVITFTKGDLSTFSVTIATGSSGGLGGVFTRIGSSSLFQSTSSLIISGSTLSTSPLVGVNPTSSQGANKYALVVSESVWNYNHNVGVPTTSPWKQDLDGTFFDRFDHNTDVSEILRYMVGVLSGSAIGPDFADATPNTNTWDNVTTNYTGQSTTPKQTLFDGVLGPNYENGRLSINYTSSTYIDFSKTASIREAQNYYITKGFLSNSDKGTYGNDTGTNPFNGNYGNIPETILQSNNFSNLTFTSTANKTGNSTVFSNSNYFGMGELLSGNAYPYSVKIISSQSYSDNASNPTPNEINNNYFTASSIEYTISDFGSSNGLFLGKILPPNNQIPAAYQDGRFINVVSPIVGRFYTNKSTDSNSISSSGYYRMFDTKSGIKSGSMSNFEFKNNSNSDTLFYTPNPYQSGFTSVGALEDITNSQPNAIISNVKLTRTAFSATSRSLSGAPYLQNLNYQYKFSSEVANNFDPVYGANVNGSNITLAHSKTNNWDSVGNPTFTPTTVSVTNEGVQTTGVLGGVLSQDKNTQRSKDSIPHITDISYLSSSYDFSLNVVYNSNTNRTLSFTSTGKNFRGTSVTSTTINEELYNASLYGQDPSSGSMQIYTNAQGYDSSTLTGFNEYFTGENFRIKITDALLNSTYAAGDKFITNSFQTNDEGDNVIGVNDLQVIPGISQGKLVKPGDPTNGYWLPAFNSLGYSYYARAFDMNNIGNTFGQQSTLKIDLGDSGIVHWGDLSGTNTISAIVIMQSLTAASLGGGNSARFIDVKNTTFQPSPGSLVANTTGLNPFGVEIDVRSNNGSGNGVENGIGSNTRFIIPLLSPRNQIIDKNNSQIILLVRYKGNPTPLTRINAFTN